MDMHHKMVKSFQQSQVIKIPFAIPNLYLQICSPHKSTGTSYLLLEPILAQSTPLCNQKKHQSLWLDIAPQTCSSGNREEEGFQPLAPVPFDSVQHAQLFMVALAEATFSPFNQHYYLQIKRTHSTCFLKYNFLKNKGFMEKHTKGRSREYSTLFSCFIDVVQKAPSKFPAVVCCDFHNHNDLPANISAYLKFDFFFSQTVLIVQLIGGNPCSLFSFPSVVSL